MFTHVLVQATFVIHVPWVAEVSPTTPSEKPLVPTVHLLRKHNDSEKVQRHFLFQQQIFCVRANRETFRAQSFVICGGL